MQPTIIQICYLLIRANSYHDAIITSDLILSPPAQGMLHQVITLPEGCGPLNVFHLRLSNILEQRSRPAEQESGGVLESGANVSSNCTYNILPLKIFFHYSGSTLYSPSQHLCSSIGRGNSSKPRWQTTNHTNCFN